MNIDTYKKVYKCNVDNLLKKYALGTQLGNDEGKVKPTNKKKTKKEVKPLKENCPNQLA